MSSMPNNGNWWQGLQSLFGGGQQQQGGYDYNGWQRQQPNYYSPIPGGGSTTGGPGPLGGDTQYNPQYWSRTGQGQGGPTYGQALAGALVGDYQNSEAARQKELGMYQGLFGNVMNSMQGAGQMVNSARQAGQQNMAGLMQQAGNMRQAADQGKRYYDQAVSQMQGALGTMGHQYDTSIGTLQKSKSDYDAGWMGDVASTKLGIDTSYQQQVDQINRRDDLAQDQKDTMVAELKQQKGQAAAQAQSSALATARNTLLNLDQNISQMQATKAGTMGQLGVGVGQAMGQLGQQTAAMRQQAEEQIGNFYNNMTQFNSSLLQNAQASALQYILNGNQAAAQLISASPFGHTSFFNTLIGAVDAMGVGRNQQINPQMANLFSRIA